MRSVAPFLALVVLAGCARPGASSSPAASTSSAAPALAAVASEATASEAPPLPPPPPGPWLQAVRERRWAAARTALDALPDEDKGRPDLRLVRAKVAHMLGDHAAVVALTDRLDLGLVADVVADLRAASALEVGPFEEAAVHYQARSGARAALSAGVALERAGKRDEARRQLDRALGAARGEAAEARVRLARARVEEALGQRQEALADARWLFLHGQPGKDVQPLLARLDAAWKPSAAERLERAGKLAQAGLADETLAEVDAASQAPGAPGTEALQRERAHLLYKLRRYAEAAQLLAPATLRDPSGDDAFTAARALSRAHRDDEAIRAYQALVRADARGPHAEEASYLAARLALLLGRHEEAERALGAYLKRFRKGKFSTAASYELALAHAGAGHHEQARAAFAALAQREDNRGEEARLRELEGASALKAGDTAAARRAFQQVMREQPLSWPALMARARLEQMGEAAPWQLPTTADTGAGGAAPVKLPTAVSFLHRLGLDDEAEDALRAQEKAVAASHGSRAPEVLCEAYGQLDPAARRYRVAQDRVKVDLVMREPGFSNRWAWDCLYPTPYADLVRLVETREGLPTGLVHAVMRQESAFDPDARSPALAEGLLQLLPTTAQEVARRASVPHEAGTLNEPAVNVDLGARYLTLLSRQWRGSLPLVVASYNAGPRSVSRWLEHASGVEADFWVARIPYGETRTYVMRVLGNLARYAYLAGGADKVPAVPLTIDTSLRADEGAF